MKTFYVILLLFCANALSYGSSHYRSGHVIVSDSVVKNRVDTLGIISSGFPFFTDRYYFRGEKLSDEGLDLLLKDIDNELLNEDWGKVKAKSKDGNTAYYLGLGFTVISLILILIDPIPIFALLFFGQIPQTATWAFIVMSVVFGLILRLYGRLTKAKANRLKRKAVERYNETVKSGE